MSTKTIPFHQDSSPTTVFSFEFSPILEGWTSTLFSYYLQNLLEGLLIRAKLTHAAQGFCFLPKGKVFLFNQVWRGLTKR